MILKMPHLNIIRKIIFTLLATAIISNAGCSSGSDSDSTSTSNNGSSVTSSALVWTPGVYTGTFTETVSNTSDDVILLVISDNHFALARTDGAEYNIGTVSDSTISTTNGFSATLNAALSGTYSAPNFSGTFTLTDTGLYNRTSSTTKLSGIWVDNNQSSGLGTLTYIIDDTGGFILDSTVTGCDGTGSFSTIDSSKNEYKYTLNMTNCLGFDGTYNGYAISDDTNFVDDTIDIIAENLTASAFLISQAIKP
jgi:hypothetical protein